MSDILDFSNNTLITGVTSQGGFLLAQFENRQAALPLYEFTASYPDIELLLLDNTLKQIDDALILSAATSYDIGLAITVNNSAFAIPVFKTEQLTAETPNLSVNRPTFVTDLTSMAQYMTIKIDGMGYGLPLFRYGGYYGPTDQAFTSDGVDTPKITTMLSQNSIFSDYVGMGSTALNPKIKTFEKIINRIKRTLGWPTININICDASIAEIVDVAIEYFTKYSGYTEEYLLFHTNLYKPGRGVEMDKIFSMSPEMKAKTAGNREIGWDPDLNLRRKVIDCFSFEQGEATGVNTLFTMEQAMVQQTYMGYMLGSNFDIATWHIVKEWLDTRKKILAQQVYWRFDPKTQLLRLIPEPRENNEYYGVIGCYVERPIIDLISEPWVIEYATALTCITIGRIYGKFTGMTIPLGGGSVNYSDVLSYGLKRKEELEKELYTGYGLVQAEPPAFFIG